MGRGGIARRQTCGGGWGSRRVRRGGLGLGAVGGGGGKSDWKRQIIPAKDSVLSMIRVACYANQISEAVEMIHHCHELGYETTLNLMAVSILQEAEIDTVLQLGAKTPISAVA